MASAFTRPSEWVKVGRFEVNTRTGARRPIPGLELGALPEEVDGSDSWRISTAGEQWGALGAGIADLPGYAAEAGLYLSNNNPVSLAGQAGAALVGEATGLEGLSWEEQRAGQQEFRNDLLDPYRRATKDIGPEVPKFSDAPIAATILGTLRSAPRTVATLAAGPAGWGLSGAQMADASYQEMKARGVPDYIAIPASQSVGGIQGALDKIGAEGAFKGVTGSVFGRALRGGALEGLTETGQELVGIGSESLTGKDQNLSEVRDRVSSAFSGGLLSGGALGAAPRIAGINEPAGPSDTQQLERRVFPDRGLMDYAKLALEDPRYAYARALTDHAQSVSARLKREMILDKQTELALKTEWDGAKDRINADPEAAVIRLDLDGVKAGNDTLGHDIADQQIFRPMADAVHQIAEKYGIGERLRFRAGGDEFILVAPRGIASQVADDLKAATAPRFIEAPPGKMLDESGIPPGEAFVQYGASVGWGMDDHSADQEVYKSKAGKPERGKLIRREKAEELVIQHEAQQAVAPPVENVPAPESVPPALSPREVLAGSGALMAVPVESVNAAIDGAAAMLSRANAIRQKYLTAEGNLPIPWMQAKERASQGQRAAKLETDFIVQDYAKAIKAEIKNGARPEEINEAARSYLEGNQEAEVPEGMKPALDQMRAYIDESISQELIKSGVAKSPEHAATILRNKGKYLYRAFKMHVEPEFKKGMVGTPTFERAVDYTLAKEDGFLQGVVESRNSLAAEYEGRAKVLAWQEQKARELIEQREAILASGGRLQNAFTSGQAQQMGAIREEAGALATSDRESSLAQIGTGTDVSLAGAETSYQEDLATLEEYERLFGAEAPGLNWAKSRLRTEHEEGRQSILRDEQALARGANSDFRSANRMAGAEYRDSSRQAREDAGFAAMAMEGDIRRTAGKAMAGIFAESNVPNTQGVLDYGRRDLRSRIALEREALRQRYAKKLGIAKNRATWAEKRIAENAANPDRRAEAEGKVGEMITFDSRPLDPKNFRGLSRAWLAKKKDIPREYLDVMGVYDDPVSSFVISSERAARTIGKRRMWDDIILGSLGKEIAIGRPLGPLSRPIEGVTFPDENGVDQPVYTSDDLYEALNEAFDVGHQATGLMKAFGILNGAIKAGDTILSIPAANRNTLSSFIALAANGNLIPMMIRHGKSSFKAAMANAGWGRKEWRQEAIEGNKYGVLGTNVDTRDLERYFRTITEDPLTRTPLKSAYKAAKDFYAFGDNFAKMVTWKSERDRYARAMDLPRTDPQVMARAAEVTKRIIQNYDRASKVTQIARDFPLAGPYVSFPAAVLSNVAGSVNTIAEDLRSDNPKIRREGIVRGAWFAGSLAGLAFGEALVKSALKDPEDEERDQEVIDDIRPLLPPWNKNSSMLLWDKIPGYIRYLDMSFLNYYDTVTRPVSMLMRGDYEKEGIPAILGQTMWDTAKKVFGEERLVGAYGDLTRGPIGGGPQVANDEMTNEVAFWRYGRWALRNVAPGTVRVLAKAVEAEPGQGLGELSALSGIKLTTVNLAKALDSTLYESAKDKRAIQDAAKNPIRSTSTLSVPELQANVDGYKASLTSIYSKALDNYQRAVRQGANPKEARGSFSEKLDKPGKIMMGLLNSGATPEVAVERAVNFEWQKRQAALLQSINEKQRDALREYQEKYPSATFDEIERRRKYLEGWAAEARQVVRGAENPGKASPSAFGVN